MKNISFYILFCLLFSCNKAEQTSDQHDHPHGNHHAHADEHAHDEHSHEMIARFTEEQLEKLAIKTSAIAQKQLAQGVNCFGAIDIPPQYISTITFPYKAKVEKIMVLSGQKVQKGTILAWVSHQDLIVLQEEYLKSKAAQLLAEQELQRQQNLQQNNAGGTKNLQTAQAQLSSVEAQVASLKHRLSQIGIDFNKLTADNLQAQLPIIAPMNGYIDGIKVNTGMILQPEQPLFELLDKTHIHAELQVFEKDILQIKTGQKVILKLQSSPESKLSGTIHLISESVDPNSKTVTIHVDIDQKENSLKKGMFVTGVILTDPTANKTLPFSAFIRHENKEYLFGKLPNGNFQLIEVQIIAQTAEEKSFEFVMPTSCTEFVTAGTSYCLAAVLDLEAGHQH